jgi:tripartite-type tricarboxylate transporter receptor subunit TctC
MVMHKALVGILVFLAGLCAAGTAMAQSEPISAVIRIVVPFAAGGSNDVIARAIAPPLAKRLGNSVVIDNRPGASGSIGSDAVARGPRDGSMLLLHSSTFLTAAATMPSTPYDVTTAFAPVAMVAEGPLLLAVSAKTGIKSPRDLISAAQAKPRALSYGSSGMGSIAHLATELLSEAAGMQMLHVPYKGAAPALIDLASGTIHLMISNYSSLVPQIKSGRIRLIAVTSRNPSPAFPDLPTMTSAVPGFVADIWVMVFAPAGTPAALVQRLNRDIVEIAKSPEVRTFLDAEGAVPTPLTPAQLVPRIRDDLAAWKKIASEKKIVAE